MSCSMRLPPPPQFVFAICIFHSRHHHRGVLNNRTVPYSFSCNHVKKILEMVSKPLFDMVVVIIYFLLSNNMRQSLNSTDNNGE